MSDATFPVETREVVFQVEDRTARFGVPIQVSTGESNIGANVGSGADVFRDKTGVTLNFRGVTGVGGITTVVNGDNVEIDGSGVGGGLWVKDEFTPTAAQITFILSQAPGELPSLELSVNGVEYDDVTDYTVSGTTVTWLNPFVLKTTDKMIIQYK